MSDYNGRIGGRFDITIKRGSTCADYLPNLERIVNSEWIEPTAIFEVSRDEGADEYVERKVVGFLENNGFAVKFGRVNKRWHRGRQGPTGNEGRGF